MRCRGWQSLSICIFRKPTPSHHTFSWLSYLYLSSSWWNCTMALPARPPHTWDYKGSPQVKKEMMKNRTKGERESLSNVTNIINLTIFKLWGGWVGVKIFRFFMISLLLDGLLCKWLRVRWIAKGKNSQSDGNKSGLTLKTGRDWSCPKTDRQDTSQFINRKWIR